MNYTIESILKKIIETPYSAFFYTPAFYKDAISYVFEGVKEVKSIVDKDSLKTGIELADSEVKKGKACFGLVPYEASYLIDDFQNSSRRVQSDIPANTEDGRIFFYDTAQRIVSQDLQWPATNDDEETISIQNFSLNTSREDYIAAIKKIKNYISEGDTYQVNYTIKSKFTISGSLSQLFIDLAFRQSARYTAIINTGKKLILTFSPELFFEKNGNSIVSHPMKGTQKRGHNSETDKANKEELFTSIKDKAENIMIVDLIRNDMSRIPGIQQVSADLLFEIQKYESLFQMISTLNATTTEQTSLWDVFLSLFPCGSITGAPKIRTMEIIKELENGPRGIYTGTIFMGVDTKFSFNIPIRTIEIDIKSGAAEMGIGSGVVWDSDAEKEYEECLLKGNFLTLQQKKFYLFESVLIENGTLYLLHEHLERLRKAAEYFLFIYDKLKILAEIENQGILNQVGDQFYLRIILYKWGAIELEVKPFSKPPKDPKITFSEKVVSSASVFQYFKTSRREMYVSELKKYNEKGFFDVLFLNEKDEITEGSFTNIFIRKGNIWLTPPVQSGLLNGVYREYLLNNQSYTHKEKILYKHDLLEADEIILTNAVRKSIRVLFCKE